LLYHVVGGDQMKLTAGAQLFRGISDRTRIRILNALAQVPKLTGTNLADLLRRPRSTVVRHLKYLYRSHLLSIEHSSNEALYALRNPDDPFVRDVMRYVVRRLSRLDGLEKDNRVLKSFRRAQ